MSPRSRRWSVASAKAALSHVVRGAQRQPQIIERRGRPVAVVVGIQEFEDTAAVVRWRRFLAVSAEIRASGGGELRVPRRLRRPSPFRPR